MTEKGMQFVPGQVDEWMDCGNKNATVETNNRVLTHLHEAGENIKAQNTEITNSIIIEPVYLGEGVRITNSVVGPHVSVHTNTQITNSVVKNSIIYDHTVLEGQYLGNSMVGNHVELKTQPNDRSIGDYSKDI
jgi:glucose-1-phosphate thymidylyltransferase